MILAEMAVLLWVVALLGLGMLGLLGMAAFLLLKVFDGVGGALSGLMSGRRVSGVRECQNPQCRQANPLLAKYCARCGSKLT